MTNVTEADVASFYDIPYYTHGTASEPSALAPTFGDKVRTHLAWRMDKGMPLSPDEVAGRGRMCDVGCGNGYLMQRFAAAGFEVVGVEPDPRARSVALQYGPVYDGSAEAIPVEVGTDIDVVVLSHSLEHARSVRRAMNAIHRIVRPGGAVIVEVPNCDALAFDLREATWAWTDVPRHIHFFTKASLSRLLLQSGFRVVRVLYVGYARQFSNDWINSERRVAEVVAPSYAAHLGPGGAWQLLLRTMLASPKRKYDSLRIHAVRDDAD